VSVATRKGRPDGLGVAAQGGWGRPAHQPRDDGPWRCAAQIVHSEGRIEHFQSEAAMATTVARTALELEIGELRHAHSAPIVTTCYLNVDGALRPRRTDYLAAFALLAQQAQGVNVEDAEVRTAHDANVAMLARWLEEHFERSRTRGLVMVCCSRDSWFRAVPLSVPVHDQIAFGHRPHLLQLEITLAKAKRFGVALVDHEKMRVFEYHLGELSESSALFEGTAPHRDRQRGWNVSSSPSGSGDAAAQWASAGTHVDRREVATAERHLVRCAAALTDHLDEHPVDHLVLGGPTPERERLERHLPDRYRSRVVGFAAVRVAAPLDEIHAAVSAIALDVEKRDDKAVRGELATASGTGLAIHGLEPVLAALSDGRVKQLFISTGLESRPGSLCTLCQALSLSEARCPVCGGTTTPVDDIVEAAVERAAHSGECRFVRREHLDAAMGGVAAIVRY